MCVHERGEKLDRISISTSVPLRVKEKIKYFHAAHPSHLPPPHLLRHRHPIPYAFKLPHLALFLLCTRCDILAVLCSIAIQQAR